MPDEPNDTSPFDEGVAPRSDARAFAPGEMVRCVVCQRANPPNRTGCLYCGAALPAVETTAATWQPALRPLEEWELGFNVILDPARRSPSSDAVLREMSLLLRLGTRDLQLITNANQPLPLARAATCDEAVLIKERLDSLGVGVWIIADRELNVEAAAPRRVSRLEMTADGLAARLTGSGADTSIAWEAIVLLVVGRSITTRVEIEERQRRGRPDEIVDAHEISADEALLDLYTASSDEGLRVAASNFDFSSLGDGKSLISGENFEKLIASLRARATMAQYDDSYYRVRRLLALVWPPELRTESQGWRRAGIGKYSKGAVTTTSNDKQFTRYSRLQYYLRLNSVGQVG